jgi:hypothetical protein
MYCTKANLAELYRESKSLFPTQTLINSPEMEIVDGVNWSFDPGTLTIWNNRYWKGFYPADYDLKNLVLMYGFGFYKRFWADKDGSKGKKIKGETHPYSSDIHAANEAIDVNLSEKGKAVYIKYRDFPFNNFDDLLKIIDKDLAIGEAFVSLRDPGRGLSIFHFVLSRRYSVDFMTQADCQFIFQSKAKEVRGGFRHLGTAAGIQCSSFAAYSALQILQERQRSAGRLYPGWKAAARKQYCDFR